MRLPPPIGTANAMCGRYASFLSAEALARIFGTVNPLPNLAPSWKSRRTMTAPLSAALPRPRASPRSADIGPAAPLDEGTIQGAVADHRPIGLAVSTRRIYVLPRVARKE
jgi:hypothetical protein